MGGSFGAKLCKFLRRRDGSHSGISFFLSSIPPPVMKLLHERHTVDQNDFPTA
jgi:hypothetical protein